MGFYALKIVTHLRHLGLNQKRNILKILVADLEGLSTHIRSSSYDQTNYELNK